MHEFGRSKLQHDIGDEQERDESRHDGGACPAHPCDLDAQRLFGERHAERVARHRGHEHRAGHGVGMVADLHEISADAPRTLAGLRPESFCQGAHDRIENAAAARRGRGSRGRDHKLAQGDGVAERQRTLADRLDDAEGDALAEAALDEAARIEERADDQPDRAVAVACQGVGRLQKSCPDGEGNGDEGHRADRQRMQDEAQHRRDKDREQMPGERRDSVRNRQEPQDESGADRDESVSSLRVHVFTPLKIRAFRRSSRFVGSISCGARGSCKTAAHTSAVCAKRCGFAPWMVRKRKAASSCK